MAEVGTVYVSVMPTTKGFAKALGSQGSAGGSAAGKAFNLSFGKLIGGTALGNLVANAFGRVTSAISSSMGAAISRVDTIANFPKVMQNLGYSAADAQASIDALSTGIDGMPTSLDGIVSMTQQLAPLCGGLDRATELSLAMNNMFLASGASTADQARAMQQYTQMLARGKVELNDWRTLQEVMPGQLNQVAQALLGAGKNSTDLYEAMKKGKVSMNDFNETVKKLNKDGVGEFASFEQQARSATEGIGTAMENVKNRIAKSVGKVLDHIGQGTISNAINGFSSQFGIAADFVIRVWDGLVSKIDFEGFKTNLDALGSAFAGVFNGGDIATSFGEQVGGAINLLIPLIQAATPLAQLLAIALRFMGENAGWLIPLIIALGIGFKAFGVVQRVTPFVQMLTGGLTTMKPAAAAAGKELVQVGLAALAVGAGILLACAGVSLLVLAAIQLAEAGPEAALALGGLVVVVAAFAAGAAALGPALTAGSVGLLAFGAAIVMVGVGVLIACAGMTLLSLALPTISEHGIGAAAAIAALGGAMFLAAPGTFLLGAALLLCGGGAVFAGIGLAAVAIAAMASFVGLLLCSGPASILGPALLQAGAGSLLLGAGLLIVAVASLAAAPGLLALGACIGGVGLALLAAVPAFMGLSGALGGVVSPLGTAASAMTTIVGACRQANAGAVVAGVSFKAMGSAMTAAATIIQAAGNRIASAQSDLAFRIQAAASRIQAAFNGMRLHIPSPTLGKMPHFSLRGSFDLQAGTVPTIDVNWYAKGGVFSSPSIIGVGEAGTEVVAPLDRIQGMIGQAVRDSSGDDRNMATVIALLRMILQAIPNLSERDLVRRIRSAANG